MYSGLRTGMLSLVVLLPVGAAAGAVVPMQVEEVVARVQERFDDTVDMRADVVQEVAIVSLGRSVSSKGTVAFRRPGKMHWALTGDEPQIIIADGKTIWFYQPADKQVLRAPLKAVFRSTTPVSFLTGVGRIADDFNTTLSERDSSQIGLFLEPKRANEDFGRLELVVSADTFDIVEARVTDPIGNVTSIRFSNLRRNLGIADSEFSFDVPPGVDVVDAPIGF